MIWNLVPYFTNSIEFCIKYFFNLDIFILSGDAYLQEKGSHPDEQPKNINGDHPVRGEYNTLFPNNPFGKSFPIFKPPGRVS